MANFTNFATERPNYFPGQYLLEDDFELQHKYLADRQIYHNKSLHVSGIIEGLEVEITSDSKGVLIKSGSAINNHGQLIVLKEDATKDSSFFDSPNIRDLTNGELFIKFVEEKQVKQQENVADSYTRWREEPLLDFAATTPDPDKCVKLAILTIDRSTGVITVDDTIREYSGLSLPNSGSNALTLRSEGNANPNLAVLTGSLKIEGNLTVEGTITGEHLSLAVDNTKRGALFLATAEDYNHALYNNNSNIDSEGEWDGVKWNVYQGLNIRVEGDNAKTTALYINDAGNVGIGTDAPGDIKLKVQGSQHISGDLTVEGTGKSEFAGSLAVTQQLQIIDTNQDANGQTLSLGSSGLLRLGYHQDYSWIQSHGEKPLAINPLENNVGIGTTDPGDYKLNVQGDQYISGNLTVEGTITGEHLSLAADDTKRGALFLATAEDYNHALYNNHSNIDNEGEWDGTKWNVYQGLNIRVGEDNAKTTALYINDAGNVGIGTDAPEDSKLKVQGSQYIAENLTVEGKGKIKQEDWIDAKLKNGWTNIRLNSTGYFKDSLGIVHLKGRVSMTENVSTNVSNIFELDEGYRPSTGQAHPVVFYFYNFDIINPELRVTVGVIFINTKGIVSVRSLNNPEIKQDLKDYWIYLDGITFRAA